MLAPHAAGWTLVEQPDDTMSSIPYESYAWVAYQHPDSATTWFASQAGSIWLDEEANDEPYHTGLISLVRDREIPKKPDRNIFAIPYREAMRLQTLEVRVSRPQQSRQASGY